MNKKIISLVLALVMVLGTFTSVFAAEPTKKAEAKKAEAGEKVEKVVGKDNKIQYVIDKKLVEGYEDGNYGLDKNIKRSEITRLLVLANGNEELAKQLQGSMKIYSDVDTKHWANGVISVGTTVPSDANGIAMLAGYPDGSFKPENDVTYAELAKMLVVLAKKDLTADMVKNAKWATSWMTWAAQLGILDDVNVVDSNKAANRADAFTMVYNALYTMKEFKRVPANETRGIISNLTKDVLTLNQDSKMEYKVTGETVFVTGHNASRQQVVRLNELNLKTDDYYLGSLVRILVNEKNEVTHIIELGNPAVLARGENAVAGKVVENDIWRGVADNTVETVNPVAKSAAEAQKLIKTGESYATVKFNDNNIDAKYIRFHNVDKVKDNIIDLKINDKTEFYVANPANNQMKKVANVNEALSLIGFHNYKDYKIAGVYAGFDSDGLGRNWKAIKYNTADRHTAKVVVFNFVNKAAEGEKYRVIESSSSKFMTTLENTDGKLFDRNNVYDTARFPLEYGDKLDVIELDTVREGSIYNTLIDHSKTEKYPIVKITKVDDDKKFIEIEDLNGEKTFLDIRDADIFSAERYGKLEEGTSIQFRVENKDSNVAEIISLLGDAKLKGSMVGVLPTADKAQRVGELVEVKNVNGVYHMVVKVDYNLFDEADKNGYATYIVADEYVEGLKANIGKDIAFKVFERNNNGLYIATDIRLNDEDQTKLVRKPGQVTIDEYLAKQYANILEAIENLTPADKVTADNADAVAKEVAKIESELDNKTEFKLTSENKDHAKKLADVKTAVENAKKN
ncbi:hypothetical protein HMPREF3023_07960 [Peptoniphilus sp. HMSC075B08]|uniref:S-layer homology domain-containing protein n=2 Tax=Peptoniphilus TaxID=162289 RepID=UPI0008A54706|nr:S-layer homology domain-containing protein [Peptoniphilus sp. HMSC075B08]OFO62461.1 hypothetical protein HMPREF3023_07960 [Peptoniphilus sp. HMSC075B08]